MNVKRRNMKTILIGLLAVTLMSAGCRRDKPVLAEDSISPDRLIDTSHSQKDTVYPVYPKEPPKDSVGKYYEKLATEKSLFNNLGCCMNETKRINQNCCCSLVLEKYKELCHAQVSNLSEIYQTDPILQDCRKKMPAAFTEVEKNEDQADGYY